MEDGHYIPTTRSSLQTSWNQKVDIKIPKTSPCYLTIYRSEESPQADHAPCNPHSECVFKSPSLKAIWEFASLEQELPLLLGWQAPCSKRCTSLPHNQCQETGFAVCRVHRLKFCSVTLTLKILTFPVTVHFFNVSATKIARYNRNM